ncbi:MAG: SH3 domain-containing protein [Lachnospiraceae bacterium]|nr:SH3 domain-containing protein [Lachnospiraceae bacterium]
MKIIQNRTKLNIICYILIAALLVSFIPSLGLNIAHAEEYTEKTGVVVDGNLYIRSGPGTSYERIGKFADGTVVNIVGEANASDGALWYKVRYKEAGVEKYGYVHSAYIANVQDVIEYSPDADFEEYLTSQGFPESYKDGLRKLHAKYPKWVFVADHIDYTWEYVVNGQNSLGRSLISVNSISSWKSLQTGAYDWENGKWIGFDGSTWVCASKEIIEYYMDPRNFFDEESVFQFNLQSYNASIHTIDGLRSLVSGSFLATGSIINDETGTEISYVDAIILAAKKSGVSPFLLASSIIFEMGNNGASNSISGTLAGYEGYYNYYNWGAAAKNGLTAIQNGLLYAMQTDEASLRPWNTRYKALVGGALKYGNGYIKVGQDTAYYKKFDYVGSPFTHQYYTHIRGAQLEGEESAEGYSPTIRKNSALVFKIPVFKNMPETPAPCPTGDGSPNNVLKALSVSGYSLTPTFSYFTQNYSLVVENDVSEITVSATAMDSTAKVAGTGKIALAEGLNEVKITVTAESGSTREYVISVVRKVIEPETPSEDESESDSESGSSGENGSSGESGSEGETETTPPTTEKPKPQITTTLTLNETNKIINGIDAKTAVSTFISKVTVKNGTVGLVDKNGAAKTTGNVATGDKIIIKDNDGTLFKEYTVVIFGDVNGDGTIDLKDSYIVRKYILGQRELSGVYLTAGDVNRKLDGVDLKDSYIIRKFILGERSINQK